MLNKKSSTNPLVLIIEDEQLLSRMYSMKLEEDGYKVLVIDKGDEAVKVAKEQVPTIILLDIMLPQMDGISILSELKADETTKNIPVIMLTNLSDNTYVEKALDLGAVSYLVKSNVVPAEVVSKVKEILEATGKRKLAK